MKIRRVFANNRRKAFTIETGKGVFEFPYSGLTVKPSKTDPVVKVFVDGDLGREAFTYSLVSGKTDTVHGDEVLEYNKDPDSLRELLLYKLTLKTQKLIKARGLTKRGLARRLKTSPTQLYRLLDQTFYGKTIDQMVRVLAALDYSVDLAFKKVA